MLSAAQFRPGPGIRFYFSPRIIDPNHSITRKIIEYMIVLHLRNNTLPTLNDDSAATAHPFTFY